MFFCFSVASPPQNPSGLLGTGSRGRPPRLSHSSTEFCESIAKGGSYCLIFNRKCTGSFHVGRFLVFVVVVVVVVLGVGVVLLLLLLLMY